MRIRLGVLAALLLFAISIQACAQSKQHEQQGITYVNQGANAYANLGGAYMQVGKNNLALEALNEGVKRDPNNTLVLYNLTALHSKLDNTDIALRYLDQTLAKGFKNYDALRFDPDLTNIRGEPEFRKVLEANSVFLQ